LRHDAGLEGGRKFSENVRIFTPTLVSLVHWLRCVEPLAEADKPPWTKPTVGVGFEIKTTLRR